MSQKPSGCFAPCITASISDSSGSLAREAEAQFDKFHILFKELCRCLSSSNEEIGLDIPQDEHAAMLLRHHLPLTTPPTPVGKVIVSLDEPFELTVGEDQRKLEPAGERETLYSSLDTSRGLELRQAFIDNPADNPRDEEHGHVSRAKKPTLASNTTIPELDSIDERTTARKESVHSRKGPVHSRKESFHSVQVEDTSRKSDARASGTALTPNRSKLISWKKFHNSASNSSIFGASMDIGSSHALNDSHSSSALNESHSSSSVSVISGASASIATTKFPIRQTLKRQLSRVSKDMPMTAFSSGMSTKSRGDGSVVPLNLEVSDAWNQIMDINEGRCDSQPIKPSYIQLSISASSMLSLEHGSSEVLRGRCCSCFKYYPRRCLATPNSPWRLCWDMTGIVFMMYDLIWIPLLMCNAQENDVSMVWAWALRVYWTCDIPATFMTGFMDQDGELVMDSGRAAWQYSRQWFLFDIILVLIDWVELVVTNLLGGVLRRARLGKLLRTVRVIRMIRLARLVKLPGVMNKFLELIFAERTVMIVSIMKITFVFLAFCHIIACVWFKIGESHYGTHHVNWLAKHGYDDEITEYTYLVSLQWAVTCFIGTMEVQAYGIWERIFSVAVLIVSFVSSASFVSAITTSVTRLQIINGQEQNHFAMLRTYLRAQGVNKKLALRITRNAKWSLASQKHSVSEQDVQLLSLVSGPLKAEMHYDMHSRVLQKHVLFKLYCLLNPAAMRRVCHEAISIITVTREEVVFRKGTRPDPPSMLFVTSGSLMYTKDIGEEKFYMDSSQFACEPTLWLSMWVHRGTLIGCMESGILRLHAEIFQHLVVEEFDPFDEDHPAWYAIWFSRNLEEIDRENVTDLHCEIDMTRVKARLRDYQKDAMTFARGSMEFQVSRRSAPLKRASMDY